jgi:hypothetical protein
VNENQHVAEDEKFVRPHEKVVEGVASRGDEEKKMKKSVSSTPLRLVAVPKNQKVKLGKMDDA